MAKCQCQLLTDFENRDPISGFPVYQVLAVRGEEAGLKTERSSQRDGDDIVRLWKTDNAHQYWGSRG